ncbi:hypothetical protein ACTHGU_14180 [Chitinophagaceae bacterium MMS25-I14]
MEHTTGKSVKNVPQSTNRNFFRAAGESSFFGSGQKDAFFPPAVKTKLAVSNPGDPQEKEADMVADKVMRMTAKMTGS